MLPPESHAELAFNYCNNALCAAEIYIEYLIAQGRVRQSQRPLRRRELLSRLPRRRFGNTLEPLDDLFHQYPGMFGAKEVLGVRVAWQEHELFRSGSGFELLFDFRG